MASLKVVLDTNALLRSISRRSAFSIILDKLYEGDYELWVSISFPSINVTTLEAFKDILSS
jgi:hypothetical protein